MSVKEVMTNLADAARARYSVSDKLTVADITDLIQGENADVAKLIDRSITKIEIPEGVTEIGKEAFRGCSQLAEVTLPSTITSIGENAFADCKELTVVYCSFEKADIAGYPWGASPGTVFYFNGEAGSSFGGLTLIAEEAGSTVKLTTIGSLTTSGLQYRTNENDEFSPYTIDTVITLTNVGDYVQFNNTKNFLSNSHKNHVQFVMTGKIAARGNIQSMLNGRTDCVDFCYVRLFDNCTALTQAPELPATTLAESCYNAMFFNCPSLTKAPDLPATTLADSCYHSMFYRCPSLTKAPDLPATTLADSCYTQMFVECALTTAPALPARTAPYYCYRAMFAYCPSLTKAPDLPATTLGKQCYEGMFAHCPSLTKAPDLPATTLADSCYHQMFFNCPSLTKINVGFTAWDDTATTDWVKGVASSGTFTCPSALPEDFSTSRIPGGWTVVRKD